MNLEAINKWLDEEYGCSYTRLLELHDFYFEKYCDLQQENKQLKEDINKIIDLIKQYGKYDGEKCTRGFQVWSADFNKILDILKEVSDEKNN